jgi:hypothetical protein
MDVKTCAKCNETKAVGEYHKYRGTKDGLNPTCKACVKIKLDAWRAANPEKHAAISHRWYEKNKPRLSAKSKATSRLYKYSLTQADLKDLGDRHNWRCGICAIELTDSGSDRRCGLHVDHDHLTGKLRGILCYACNCSLGLMKDDPRRLERAAAYLRAYRATCQTLPSREQVRAPAAPGSR